MAYYHTPGISLAVVNDGRIEWARGFGYAEAGRPVTESTLFQAGSIRKPVFALAVVRLAQEGKVDLDEDVRALPEVLEGAGQRRLSARITLRRLLTHSAGLTVHGFPGYGGDEALPGVTQILDG